MKKVLFATIFLTIMVFIGTAKAQIIDNFDTDKGTFNRGTATAGQIAGIFGTMPELDATKFVSGTQSLKVLYRDDAAGSAPTDNNWYDRFLSDAGVATAKNLLNAKIGYVGFWLETSTAAVGAKVSILLKDVGTSSYYVQSIKKDVINGAGVFKIYEWDLTDKDQWGDWTDQNGTVVLGGSGGQFNGTALHINAIIFQAPANSADWTLNLDDVGRTDEARDQNTGFNSLVFNMIQMYPTIFESNVTLQLNLEKSKSLEIQIFDYQGRQVISQSIEAAAGATYHTFDMSQMASSLYIAKIMGENINQSIKLVKK